MAERARARPVAAARRLLSPGSAGEARGATGRRIVGNISLQFGGRGISMVISLLTLPLAARTLGAAEFGIYSAGLAYVGLFGTLTEFGLTNAATLRMSADPDHEGAWLSAVTSLRTIMGVVLAVIAAATVPLFLDGTARIVAWIFCAGLLTTGAGALMSVFQSRLRAGVPIAIGVTQSVLWLIACIALAATDGGPVAFALSYVLLGVFLAGLQIAAARRIARVAWRGMRARWRALLRVAVPIGLGGLFVQIYWRIDSILLLSLSGAHEAGIYSAAYKFLDPLIFLPAAIMSSFVPVLSADLVADRPRVKRLVQRSAEAMAVLALPGVAISLVLSDEIINLLFGAGYQRSAGVLPILMGAFVFICYGNLAGYLAPVVGVQWRITLFAAIGAACNVVLNVLLIKPYGAYGAAWVTLVTEALTMSLLLSTGLRALGLRLTFGRIARTACAAAVMGGVMLALRPLGLVPALLGGVAAYAPALLVLGAVSASELRALRAGRA